MTLLAKLRPWSPTVRFHTIQQEEPYGGPSCQVPQRRYRTMAAPNPPCRPSPVPEAHEVRQDLMGSGILQNLPQEAVVRTLAGQLQPHPGYPPAVYWLYTSYDSPRSITVLAQRLRCGQPLLLVVL